MMENRSLQTLLATGGAGFIGSHLVDALRQAGHEVSVIAHYIIQAPPGQPLSVYGDGLQTRSFTYV